MSGKPRYKKGGVAFPGVTDVLKAEGLIDTRFFTKEAMERGTEIHDITVALDKFDIDTQGFDIELRGYVEAYKKFKAESDFEVEGAEVQIISEKFGFAGTIDRIGKVIDVPALLDIKTGKKLHWHSLQLAGYMILSNQHNCELWSLYLRDNGTYKLNRHLDTYRARNIFMSALNLYHYKVENGIIK